MRVGGQRHAPAAVPQERPGTHRIGGWVGPGAGPDGCGKSRSLTGIRSPDRPACSQSLYKIDTVTVVMYICFSGICSDVSMFLDRGTDCNINLIFLNLSN